MKRIFLAAFLATVTSCGPDTWSMCNHAPCKCAECACNDGQGCVCDKCDCADGHCDHQGDAADHGHDDNDSGCGGGSCPPP